MSMTIQKWRPSTWKCLNPDCSNLISDIIRRGERKYFCSTECKKHVEYKKKEEWRLKYNEIHNKSYYKNHEKERERQRLYREKNREKINEMHRQYQKTVTYKRKKKLYYYKNREARLAYRREYYLRKKLENESNAKN